MKKKLLAIYCVFCTEESCAVLNKSFTYRRATIESPLLIIFFYIYYRATVLGIKPFKQCTFFDTNL